MELAELTASVKKSIPKGSGDYSAALALVMFHKRGSIDFAALQKALLARKLPAHPQGDDALMGEVAHAHMPTDWAGTWGEVAMAYHLGELTRTEYGALHAAAHPRCSKK